MKAKIVRNSIMAATVLATVTACAGGFAGQDYQPVVDTYNSPGKDPSAYAGDLQYCQMLAEQRPQVVDTAKGAGLGAILGGAAGALAGTAVGRPAYGAAVGAGLATLIGGTLSGVQSNDNRQNVVMDCVRARGWVVVGR